MKRILSLALSALLALSVIVPIGAAEIAPADTLDLYYDDHVDYSGKTVTILDAGTPTSKQVGSTALDTAVVTLDGDTLIATGIGTAQVSIDGKTYSVNVTAAEISLFMITGHSIGAGQCGNGAQSVLCPDGQVYSSYGPTNLSEDTDGVGISYAAQKKAKDVNAFTASGAGTRGEGSALGYYWNQITGQKVMILNTAVGGSCLPQWIQGTKHYNNAVAQYTRAQQILKNEIDAGHYTLGKMGIFYHSGANFQSQGYANYSQQQLLNCYDSMWNGFKRDLAVNIGGKEQTVSFLGLIPIWIKDAGQKYERDEPLNTYLAASAEYPDIFLATTIGGQWLTNADVQKNFPKVDYQTHSGTLKTPTTVAALYNSDNVHYLQVAYNAQGYDMAKHLDEYLRGSQTAEVSVSQATDFTPLEDNVTINLKQTLDLVVHTTPITVNDLTIEISGCITSSLPLKIKATGEGTGTLTISRNGTVLKKITFTCSDHKHTYNASVTVTAPTCTARGYTTYTCSCGKSYTSDFVDMLPHTEVVDPAVAPTCSREGKTEGKHCSVCNKVIVEQKSVAKLAHTFEGRECTVCGAWNVDYPCDGGAECPAHAFTDVVKTKWYHNAIDYAVSHKLFNGTSSDTFEPESPMTRAMLVTVLWRSAGEPTESENTFKDVPAGKYYTQAVAWAATKGIVNGTSPDMFEPDENVTREQLATILFRYANTLGADTSARGNLSGFSDSGKSHAYAVEALRWAVGAGIIKGDPQGNRVYLDPQGNATRAQVATILMRFLENVVE